MAEDEIELNFSIVKKIKWTYVLLGIFIVFGFYLRVYHIDFPAIGYHNMKENEYISETIFFNEQGNLLHRQTYNFYGLWNDSSYYEEYAEPPLIPYMTLPFWKIFGEQLWVPRLIIILFMLGSIIVIYAVTKLLTKNEYLALLGSFLLTIMPLAVYFGRNIQPESPALFFELLAFYYFIKWSENFDKKTLFFAALYFGISGAFKETFLIILIPMLFVAPYKRIGETWKKNKKEIFQQLKYSVYGIIPFIILQGAVSFAITNPLKETGIEPLSVAFARAAHWSFWVGTWPSISSYINDNYTWVLFDFALIGLLFMIIKYKTKLSKFLIGNVVGLIIYLGICSGRIGGHAYYQMPFLPLIILLILLFLYNIGMILKQITKIKYIEYAALLLLIFAIGPIHDANNRVFGTIFYGQDVIGQYLQENMGPNDRFFNIGESQSEAVCTYARRRCGGFQNLSDLLTLQNEFNIQYMNFDAYTFSTLSQDNTSYNYIKNNYHIDLIGLIPENNQLGIMNVLLKRGGTMNLTQMENKTPQLAKTYDTPYGPVPFYVVQNLK